MWAVQYVSDVEMTPKHAKPYSRGISMGKYLCKFTLRLMLYSESIVCLVHALPCP